VVDASVEAEGDDLVVRWTLSDGRAAVDVGTGPTPEAVDHAHAVTVGAGQYEVSLRRPGSGRPYVSVGVHGAGGAMVVAERRVPFAGVTNFRDLGGYPAAGGGRTRWGRVFRSDGLHMLTAAEMATYEALGLRAVYDLRGDAERERHPDPVTSAHLPLLSAVVAGPEPEPDGARDAAWGERRLHELYRGMLAHAGPLFGRLFEGLAAEESLPAVFHCTGGKDRTGLSAAILLELLGVPRDMVLDDYTLTSRFRLREHQSESYENLLASGMPPEAAAGVLGAPRWAMAEALRELDESYGGAEAYLRGPARMGAPTLERLRALLVA
jgi:protein-tyrosine phosphatase